MPSASVYLPTDDWDYLDAIADARGLDNPSQALQEIIKDHREER